GAPAAGVFLDPTGVPEMPRNRKDHDRALSSCHGARLVVLSSELLKVLRSILIPTLLSFNPIAPFGTPQQVFYPHAPRGSGEPRRGHTGRVCRRGRHLGD